MKSFNTAEEIEHWLKHSLKIKIVGMNEVSCSSSTRSNEARLTISVCVFDRDDGNEAVLRKSLGIHLPAGIEYLLSTIRWALIESYTHEIDEGIVAEGIRVFDPHVSIQERTCMMDVIRALS